MTEKSLRDLFAEAEKIGGKYQSKKEKSTVKKELEKAVDEVKKLCQKDF